MARIIKEDITKKVSLSNSDLNDYLPQVIRTLLKALRHAKDCGYEDVTLETLTDEDGNIEVWGNRKETEKELRERLNTEKRIAELRRLLKIQERGYAGVRKYKKLQRQLDRLEGID
jgi:hypothetical protein